MIGFYNVENTNTNRSTKLGERYCLIAASVEIAIASFCLGS